MPRITKTWPCVYVLCFMKFFVANRDVGFCFPSCRCQLFARRDEPRKRVKDAQTAYVRDLIARAQKGDRHAQGTLITRVYPILKQNVDAYVQDESSGEVDIEDAVQEISICLLNSLTSFRFESNARFHAWIRRIARRWILNEIDRRRAQKRDSRKTVSLESVGTHEVSRELSKPLAPGRPFDETSRSELRQLVRFIVENLPASEARIIRLVTFGGYSVNKAAGILGIPESTARLHYHAALARLGLRLSKLWKDVSEGA